MKVREAIASMPVGTGRNPPANGGDPVRIRTRRRIMLHLTRRKFLQTASAAAASVALSPFVFSAADEKNAGFSLPKLPYAYDALEPTIDAETMKIHHNFHHKAYVDNLNKALAGQSELLNKSIVDILRDINSVPE